MAVLARLSRTIPLLIVLAILAGIVYAVVLYKSSPNRAKEVLIKLFTAVFVLFTAVFALLTVYAVAEANVAVAELWGTFGATTLIGLGVVAICRWRFVKNHPNYKEEMTANAQVIPNLPWPLNILYKMWKK